MNSLDMQVVHITTTKNKNFKMVNLIHMISVLNFIFSLCYTRRDEQNKISFTYVFKEFLN
jgi:hypothetical protein